MEKIGQGGTGIVYKAYDFNLQKYVVVKKIKDNFSESLNNRMEVDILKKLHHMYLPQVYDFIVIDRKVFTVMDYVEGHEMKWYTDQGITFDEQTIKRWLVQLLEVLQYLHSQIPPIIHSDIKPANIMITRENNVCLIDFNISLGDGDMSSIYGISKEFASPEQMEKAELAFQGFSHQHILLDERSDIYSLGKTLLIQMEAGVQHGMSYTDTLWEIIGKSVMNEKKERYASAEKMLYAVRNMEKLDKDYRRLWITKLFIYAGYGICMLTAALLLYFGYGIKEREEYEKQLGKLKEYAENSVGDELISGGIRILNSSYYKKIEAEDPEMAAYVLHAVGEGYFLNENYEEASHYYELAVRNEQGVSDALYYVDYAIAEARAGKYRSALAVLENAKKQDVDKRYLSLVEGEIHISQGDYKTAEKILKELSISAKDRKIKVQAYMKLAELYQELGNRTEAIQYLEMAGRQEQTVEVLRKLGYFYNEMGRQKDALQCYKKLCDRMKASFEDWMNYIICCEELGNNSEGIEICSRISTRYPDRYEIPMHSAWMAYRSGKKNQAVEYYEKAKKLYKGETDNMMSQLREILEG